MRLTRPSERSGLACVGALRCTSPFCFTLFLSQFWLRCDWLWFGSFGFDVPGLFSALQTLISVRLLREQTHCSAALADGRGWIFWRLRGLGGAHTMLFTLFYLYFSRAVCGDLLSFGTVRHERVQCCYAKQRQRFKQPTLMAADMAFNVAMLVFSVAMLFQLCMQTCSIAALLSSALLLISTTKWNFSPCNKTFILMWKCSFKT